MRCGRTTLLFCAAIALLSANSFLVHWSPAHTNLHLGVQHALLHTSLDSSWMPQQSSAQPLLLPGVAQGSLPESGSLATVLNGTLPPGFDWQAYLLYYPELLPGIRTEEAAQRHYIEHGRAENRVFRRLRVVLRYTACSGLINQQYAHIAALSVAAMLGAELVLPPAVHRSSFSHRTSVNPDLNEAQWSDAPLESLLDVDRIVAFWAQQGLTLHKTPTVVAFPDMEFPDEAYPMYNQAGIDPLTIVKMPSVHKANARMSRIIQYARQIVLYHASALQKKFPERVFGTIVLNAPCTFFMLRTRSKLKLAGTVAKSLWFAREVQELADKVLERLTLGGTRPFDGVHLRLERDAEDWARMLGGFDAMWAKYLTTMAAAGFNESTVLYVASGLLSYSAGEDMQLAVARLLKAKVCHQVLHKELYLLQSELAGLHTEQKALVDLLVLTKARRFVGLGASTFSFYLREHRALMGIPKTESILVNVSEIGTDWVFDSAGVLSD